MSRPRTLLAAAAATTGVLALAAAAVLLWERPVPSTSAWFHDVETVRIDLSGAPDGAGTTPPVGGNGAAPAAPAPAPESVPGPAVEGAAGPGTSSAASTTPTAEADPELGDGSGGDPLDRQSAPAADPLPGAHED